MPRVRVHELDQFFRDLRETVLALEQAYVQGTLAEQLKQMAIEARFGNGLARSYRFLLKASRLPDPEGLRRKTVHALLEQTRDELFETDIWFYADIQTVAANADPSPAIDALPVSDPSENSVATPEIRPAGLVPEQMFEAEAPVASAAPLDSELEAIDTILADEEGIDAREDATEVLEDLVPVSSVRYIVSQGLTAPVSLRLDQVLAARSWGLGFFFNDMEETDRVTDLRARLALEHLARDLLDLSRMLPRLLRGKQIGRASCRERG